MKHPDIIRLEELFKRHPAASPRLLKACGQAPAQGQLWEISGPYEPDCFREVLVLSDIMDEDGPAVVDAAPLVHDATLAGPLDIILPEHVFCHHAAVLPSLVFSLPTEKLTACVGALEEELVGDLVAHCRKVQEGTLAEIEQHAPDYFDAQDLRYRFHEDAAQQIVELQAPLYQWLDDLEEEGEWENPEAQIIDASHLFGLIPADSAMAAAGEGRPSRLEELTEKFDLDGQPAELRLSRSVKPGFWAMVVRGATAGQCANLLSSSGEEHASFVYGEARFEWTEGIGDVLILVDHDGRPLLTLKIR